jgi:signal transduction histidine kinase
MSFRLKTIFGIALIELSIMAILITVNQLNLGGTASSQLYERVRSTGDLFATMVADAVLSTDLATLDAMIENTLANDDLIYLRVRSASGVVLSEGGDPTKLAAEFREDANFDAALSDNRIDLSSTIQIAGQSFGSIEIGVSTLPVEAEMAGALRLNLIVALGGVALVALFGSILGSVLTRQLSSLRQGARMIAAGNLGYQIDVRGRDELADTAHCFNQMARKLAEDRDALELKQSELLEKRDRTNLIVDSLKEIAAEVADVNVPDTERDDEIGDMARATVVFRNAMAEVQAARAEQARLIHAFDQLDEQVAIFDEAGKVIFLNSAFRLFNAPVLEKLEDEFTYAGFLKEGLRQSAFPGAAGHEEAWLARRLSEISEDDVPVEIARAPDRTLLVTRTSVEGIGMVISASDVTELKTSQAQLIQASKLATLGEMATGIAHELNQPLGVIRMAANNSLKRIQKGSVDPEYLVGKLTRMSEQTERAAQIINHMRIFGRTADGEDRTFDLVQSLESACNLMSKQLQLAGIALETDLPEQPMLVAGQQIMFEQVIMNLISNARDAIEGNAVPEGVSAHVRVTLNKDESTDEQVSVLVEDTGGGIPDAVLERLFDPFFTTKEPGKGTGLGLSISYSIIREMGGTISVCNTNAGAQFRIDLPTSRADVEERAA